MLRLQAENLSALSGIAHGFFGRTGGVSQGIYTSLNCGPGSKDEPVNVKENRARILAVLGGVKLASLYQVHGTKALDVQEVWADDRRPEADAMVTNMPGIALGILTADCGPILFADEKARVVGAAHAGWKGALSGVIESALAAMEKLGAHRANIKAAVGPCIGQASYEVGPEFRDRFLMEDPPSAKFFAPAPRRGHYLFDLPGYVTSRLTKAGVGSAMPLGVCTYEGESDFFSFRRTTHRKEPDYGRQISAIMLTPGS